MKKPVIALLVILVLFTLGFAYVAITMVSGMNKKAEEQKKYETANSSVVEKGEVKVEVIETGPLEARKLVEVKSRVAGRVKELLVDEGDMVVQGQLVAVIDPQETQLQVKQNQAQLRGAQSSVDKMDVDIAQRRVTAVTNLERARSRVRQLSLELKQQPVLTSSSVKTAESALTAAKQNLDLLIRVTQPNTKAQVDGALSEAESNLSNAKTELQRRTALLEKGYISKREQEQAQLNVDLAQSRLLTAKERLANLEREQLLERRSSEERVRQAQFDLNRSRANGVQDTVKKEEYRQAIQSLRDAEVALRDVQGLEAAKRQQLASVDQLQSVLSDSMRQLGETAIRAPVSGIVTKKLVQLGELVSSLSSFSSGTPIFRIEDRSVMKVKLNINEIDVARLGVGSIASIRIDAFPDDQYGGIVTKIAPASNETQAGASDPVVKYTVEVTLNNAPSKLKSGMSAMCTIKIVELKDVLVVRRDFLGQKPDKSYYLNVLTGKPGPAPVAMPGMKVKEDLSFVKETPIRIGAGSGTYVQVVSGVKEGTKIWKPKFSGPNRKTFFMDGDEAERAEANAKEAEENKAKDSDDTKEKSGIKVEVN